MITLHDLDTAIAKCQGLPDPKPSDAIKLAAFYIIRNEMFGQQERQTEDGAYSYASDPVQTESVIDYYGESEFAKAIDGRNAGQIWPIMDELMSVLQVTNRRLYSGVMRKIEQ